MPRVLRSPQAKLSEIGNVSVPDADGAGFERRHSDKSAGTVGIMQPTSQC